MASFPARRSHSMNSMPLTHSHLSVAIAAMLAAGPVTAATIIVDDECTLADAIEAVNTQQSVGDCPAGDGDEDTIVLPGGALDVDQWLPLIEQDVIIEGQGREDTIIDGNFERRPFFVQSGTVVFRDLAIANGRAEGGVGRSGGGGGAGLGGALFVYSGNVTLRRVNLTGNIAHGGASQDGNRGGGGGLAGDGGNGDFGGGGGGGFFGDGGDGGDFEGDGQVGEGFGAGGGGGSDRDGGDGGQGGQGGAGSSDNGGGGGSDADGQAGEDGGGGADGGFLNGGGGSGYLPSSPGGAGGFGGGGGGAGISSFQSAGNGGFGGGGGSGIFGGVGGFGGGGGAGGVEPGSGGFGAGDGDDDRNGGGGGGFGGAVFVQSGDLTLQEVSLENNRAERGASGGNDDEGRGGALFLCDSGEGDGQIDDASAETCATEVHTQSCGVSFSINSSDDGEEDVFGPWEEEFSDVCVGELALEKAVTGGLPATEAGDMIEYTMTVTNVGDFELTGVSIADFLLELVDSCDDLARSETCELTGTYELTQNDIDAGQVTNTVSANSDQTDQVNTTLTVSVGDPVFLDRFEDVTD